MALACQPLAFDKLWWFFSYLSLVTCHQKDAGSLGKSLTTRFWPLLRHLSLVTCQFRISYKLSDPMEAL